MGVLPEKRIETFYSFRTEDEEKASRSFFVVAEMERTAKTSVATIHSAGSMKSLVVELVDRKEKRKECLPGNFWHIVNGCCVGIQEPLV